MLVDHHEPSTQIGIVASYRQFQWLNALVRPELSSRCTGWRETAGPFTFKYNTSLIILLLIRLIDYFWGFSVKSKYFIVLGLHTRPGPLEQVISNRRGTYLLQIETLGKKRMEVF